MERLTKCDEFGNADIIGVDSNDLQMNLDFDEFNKVTNALNKLAEYEDLEEQGKLLKLDCAVGDTVYEVQKLRERIQEYIITAVYALKGGITYEWKLKDRKGIYGNLNGFSKFDIRKTVFLTEEEAEAALKESRISGRIRK